MKTICLLDKQTIDKIAAGEVVDRPASIVKELVENAIDAGANAVTVEIKEGGISFIRITDNGSGIPKDQVKTAFLRHATSKIRSVDDLEQIQSLGFRGEALSSIAAVAQVELITKPAEALMGIRYQIEGGVEVGLEDIGAPNGTTFLVRNLFFHTPARAKFLKSASAEGNAISALVEQLALSNPSVSFKYMMNGQVKLHTTGNLNRKELVYQIYGRELTKELLELNYQDSRMKVEGFIAKPVVSRGNRNFENYYVNGRYVKSRLLAKAIEDGYHGFMMQHKYPFTLLYITMNGTEVDVNVHPSKMELRFSSQEEIYRALVDTIRQTLMQKERIPDVNLGRRDQTKTEHANQVKPQIPEPFETQRRASMPIYPKQRPGSGADAYMGNTKGSTLSDAQIQNQMKILEMAKRAAMEIHERGIYTGTNTKAPTDKDAVQSTCELPRTDAQHMDTPPGEPSDNTCIKNSERSQPEQSSDKPCFKDQELSQPERLSEETALQEPTALQPERSQDMPQVQEQEVPQPVPMAGTQMELFEDRVLSPAARQAYKIIGQLFDTYWLIQYEDNLYIIDQHAAHEKVMYERMMKEYHQRQVLSQMISPPLVVSLTLQETELLERYRSLFADFGFEIENFGGREFQITAVPDHLYGIASEEIFREILDQLEETGAKTLDAISEKLASMSCKAAVKGNQQLSIREVEALLDELLALENPYNCPHGRPTIVSMSKYELEKKFKRIV